ncbi:response regulator [Lachnospiraceae bacterium OttesenSCG-928-D06]|nr:response regulator [Lachnospiraceae bacterium OttesenSCG-928-D06]
MDTVLIADDELAIRTGLKSILDWNRLGFSICGEAGNGQDALTMILDKKPDLVLLDIRMPKLNGTDVIRIARDMGYKGRFIILSGYSDFTYAQTAIHYGVNFYLTKPIDEEELQDSILAIQKQIQAERLKTDNIQLLKDKAKNVILHEIVTGTYETARPSFLSQEDIEEMNLAADVYQVVIYEKFNIRSNEISYSFADLLKVTNKGDHTFSHFKEDGNDVILLKGSFALSKFQDFLTRYEDHPPQKGSPLDSLFLAYGQPVDSLDEAYLSYEEALSLCKRRFFCIQGQHTLGYEELPSVTQCQQEISNEKLTEYSTLFADYLLSFNRNMIASTLHSLEEFLYNVKNDITSVKLFLTDLYLRIREKANSTYPTAAIPFPTITDAIEYIEHCNYLYEIIFFLSEQMKMVTVATKAPTRDTILNDILHYIDHNYRSNIKLENISPLFGYSSTYLGKVFHKATGKSFNSYIDSKRIAHSKELLLNGSMKVYEIAEHLGYGNVDYFHKKFKKYEGISPAEYRKQYAQVSSTETKNGKA